MSILKFGCMLAVQIIILDILAGLLQKHTRTQSYAKSAGLYGLLALGLTSTKLILVDKKASLYRFVLASFTSLILIISSYFSRENNIIIFLILIFMPFYYILYALLGHDFISISSSIRNFRTRAFLGLTFGANIFLAKLIFHKHIIIYCVHASIALIALAHIFYFCSKPRAGTEFFSLEHEDYDVAQPAFMNYLVSILELYIYILFFYNNLAVFIIKNKIINILYYIIIYILIFVLAKILLVSREIIKAKFYEEYLVPISFLFFASVYIYQVYA